MYVPHQRYLDYLISRDTTVEQVETLCKGLELPLPHPVASQALLEYHARLSPSINRVAFWSDRVTRSNLALRRWLMQRGVLSLWEDHSLHEALLEVVRTPAVRLEVETLVLQGHSSGVVAEAARSLGVPLTASDVESYKYYLWDLKGMGFREWDEYFRQRWSPVLHDIVKRTSEKNRDRFDDVDTDEVDTLGAVRLLRSSVLRKVRSLARQELSGQEMLAFASLGKVALEAMAREDDLVEKREAAGKADDFTSIVERYQRQLQQIEIKATGTLATLDQVLLDEDGSVPALVQGGRSEPG